MSTDQPPLHYAASEEDIRHARDLALEAYAQRAVMPLFGVMPRSSVDYLRAMLEVIGEDRIAATHDIASKLGKSQQQTSRARRYLIDNGIVISTGYGRVAFGIPYLESYFDHHGSTNEELTSRAVWKY